MAKFVFYRIPDNLSKGEIERLTCEEFNRKFKENFSQEGDGDLEIGFSDEYTPFKAKARFIISLKEIIDFDLYFFSSQMTIMIISAILAEICQKVLRSEVRNIETKGKGKKIHFSIY